MKLREYLRMTVQDRGGVIAIVLLSVITLLLRFKGLTYQSYWFDELYSIATSMPENSVQDILNGSFTSVHPPMFHLLLWWWFKFFGFTEFSGRAFPALTGTLCIPAIYFLGKELFNKEIGIYAATIAIFNFFLIYYSQEVRPYSLYLLFSLLSLLFYVKTLKTCKKRNLFVFLLVTSVLLYIHYYGFLVVVIEVVFLGIYLLVNRTNTVCLLIFALVSSVILFVVLLPIIPSIFTDVERLSFWIQTPPADFFIDYFTKYFGRSSVVIFLVLVLMIKGFIDGTDLQRNESKIFGLPFIVLWLIIIFLVPYIKSITSLPVLIPRTLIIAVPAILYLASLGLSFIKQSSIKYILFCGIIVMSAINLFWENNYYKKIQKEEYRFIITEVIKKYPEVPVYSKENERGFNAYSKMLGLAPRIQNIAILKQHLKDGTVSECFILVEGHYKLRKIMKKEKIINRYHLKEIKKVRKKNVEALFLSINKTPKSICDD